MKEQMRNDLGLPDPRQANAGPMPSNNHNTLNYLSNSC